LTKSGIKNNENLFKKFDDQITICAHDAGAAQHLLKIYDDNISKTKLCLEGPALNIFNTKYKNLKIYDLKNSLEGSKYLISGTGWSSTLEHNARKAALNDGIFNISIIDHWVNYSERFQRGKEIILPNEIWVTDEEAEKLACSIFKEIPINKIPNFWLDDLKNKVISKKSLFANKFPNTPPARLLYLTEPIRSNWGGIESGEFQSMRYFFKNLKNLSNENYISPIKDIEEIIIKLHPSEELSKYDDLLNELNLNIPIKVNEKIDLIDLLSGAEACFGCETQALVVSIACGLPTYSVIPPWGPKCRLPHNEIKHIRNIIC